MSATDGRERIERSTPAEEKLSQRCRRAFTLTEVLLALLITVCGILPLLHLNTVSRRRGQQGEALAQAQIEGDRLLRFFTSTLDFVELERLLGGSAKVTLDDANENVKRAIADGKVLDAVALGVSRRVEISRPSKEAEGLLRVKAVLSWSSAVSRQEQTFQADRFVIDPMASLRQLWAYQSKPPASGCDN